MDTYRETATYLSYGQKVDLIKNVFLPEKNFPLHDKIRSFKYVPLASLFSQ